MNQDELQALIEVINSLNEIRSGAIEWVGWQLGEVSIKEGERLVGHLCWQERNCSYAFFLNVGNTVDGAPE